MPQDREASTGPVAQDSNIRHLLIGNENAQGQLNKQYLAELSYQITTADSPEQTAAAFNPSTYDCIVADPSLPDVWPTQSSQWYGELAQRRISIVVSYSAGDIHYARQHHPELP